jgi:hypothetical protein
MEPLKTTGSGSNSDHDSTMHFREPELDAPLKKWRSWIKRYLIPGARWCTKLKLYHLPLPGQFDLLDLVERVEFFVIYGASCVN